MKTGVLFYEKKGMQLTNLHSFDLFGLLFLIDAAVTGAGTFDGAGSTFTFLGFLDESVEGPAGISEYGSAY